MNMSNDRFKFRVWDNEEKEYLQEGALLDSRTGNIAGYFPDDKFTIEQCTGLHDKNGNFIYEGDVIGENGFRKYIYWHKNGWVYSMNGTNKTVNWQLKEDDAAFSEIIGNIHESEGKMSKVCGECRRKAWAKDGLCRSLPDNNPAIESCFEPKSKPTVFDRLTASPEVLAEKLVYRYDGNGTWRSFLLYGYEFLTKEEAHAATVARLQETAK